MSIILAYTPNASAEAAVDFALREAAVHNTKLVVVNSSRGAALGDPRLASAKQLDQLRSRAVESGVDVEIEQPVRNEDPDFEILDAAERHNADLIVIGTRRRSTMGKFILGSTAQRIIMDAEVPVVAVKPSQGKG